MLIPRLLGAATLAYSVASLVQPKVIAGPCGMVDDQGEVVRDVATAVRAVAARDALICAAMLVVPAGDPLRAVTTVRGLFDLTDAAVFGSIATTPQQRRKIVAVTAGWGSLCLLSRRWAG